AKILITGSGCLDARVFLRSAAAGPVVSATRVVVAAPLTGCCSGAGEGHGSATRGAVRANTLVGGEAGATGLIQIGVVVVLEGEDSIGDGVVARRGVGADVDARPEVATDHQRHVVDEA